MERLHYIEDIQGKRIEKVFEDSDRLCLKFDDETYFYITIDLSDESIPLFQHEDEIELDIKYEVGLISESEYQEIVKENKEKDEARLRKIAYENYLFLKKKYGFD